MGATVTCGKAVFALRTQHNKVLYVLFEETYEKNCYPHTPSWCCYGIGYLPQVLRRIYRATSATIGGCLQGRNGYISPVNYLKGWMEELKNPLVMPDEVINLTCGSGFYDALQTDVSENDLRNGFKRPDQIREGVINAGIDVAPLDSALENGSYKAPLSEIADLVDYLCQNRVYSWRLLRNMPMTSQRDPTLGYCPGRPVKEPFKYRYVHLKTNVGYGKSMLRQEVQTGVWSFDDLTGLAWLDKLAAEEELANPGSVQSSIAKHLKASCEAKFAGLDTVFTVVRPVDSDFNWLKDAYRIFVERLGFIKNGAVPESVTITLRDALVAAPDNSIYCSLDSLKTLVRDIEVFDESLVDEAQIKLSCLQLQQAA